MWTQLVLCNCIFNAIKYLKSIMGGENEMLLQSGQFKYNEMLSLTRRLMWLVNLHITPCFVSCLKYLFLLRGNCSL